jgi:mRNA-degrading endonuclease RelE of RelBE toxin-antitoxin system
MYRLKIPTWVRSSLTQFKKDEPAHFRSLEEQLEKIRSDPKSAGIRTRLDLADCYFILLRGYMLFYIVAENQNEVRFFHVEKKLFSW